MSDDENHQKTKKKRKPVILIIDDDPDLVDTISYSLSDRGYQVVSSPSMEDALTNFDHLTCNLIITDIFMEGIGGIRGIKEIKMLQQDAKIIAMSGGYLGMSREDALAAAKKIGADRILAKPFKMDQLEQYVSHFLD